MIQTVEISTSSTGSSTLSIIKSSSGVAGQTLIGAWPTAGSASGIALHAGASDDVVAWFALTEHAVPCLIGGAVLDAEVAANVVASLAHTC